MSLSRMEVAREVFRKANKVCVLTGSGVSAESGIPTFRGEEGLWKRYNPYELATPEAFAKDPLLVWEWYCFRRDLISKCLPNPGHHAIARMDKEKNDFLLITQNIDGLHRRAGSERIVEMHGNIWEVRCVSCDDPFCHDEEFETLPPRCSTCGNLLRPNVVWFGEKIPGELLDRSMEMLLLCDLFIVAGTSGVVQPAASFAHIASSHGSRVVEVNIDAGSGSRDVDYFLKGKSGEIFPCLVEDDGS